MTNTTYQPFDFYTGGVSYLGYTVYDEKDHLRTWSNHYFGSHYVPNASGGFSTDWDKEYDRGLRACLECGMAILVDHHVDVTKLNLHRAHHDRLTAMEKAVKKLETALGKGAPA